MSNLPTHGNRAWDTGRGCGARFMADPCPAFVHTRPTHACSSDQPCTAIRQAKAGQAIVPERPVKCNPTRAGQLTMADNSCVAWSCDSKCAGATTPRRHDHNRSRRRDNTMPHVQAMLSSVRDWWQRIASTNTFHDGSCRCPKSNTYRTPARAVRRNIHSLEAGNGGDAFTQAHTYRTRAAIPTTSSDAACTLQAAGNWPRPRML